LFFIKYMIYHIFQNSQPIGGAQTSRTEGKSFLMNRSILNKGH
jgi:hypothetical protein